MDPMLRPDLTADEFRAYAAHVADWIARYRETIRDRPVLPTTLQPGDLTRQLPAAGPDQGEPMDAILADFERLIPPTLTHWSHPRFHAFFSVSTSGPGILAEMLTAALNVNGMLWRSCPAATELELVCVDWVRQWLGLGGPEPWFGMIHDTASSSTMHALVAARDAAEPESRTEGSRPGLVVYCSEQAHSSVEKSALTVGFGQRHVRKIPLDAQFRLRPDALQHAIHADRAAGLRPCCVVATVGTTATTAIDPVPAIAEIAARENLWLHVDAAYGGAVAVVPEHRHVLDGCDRADSLVMNPHKWLFVPIDCSLLYTRRPDVLRRAFSLVPDYLQTTEEAVNLMDYSVVLGRRFRALKLWFVLRYFGRDGIADVLRRQLAWTQELAALIAAHPSFELAAPVPMSTICFRLRDTDEENRRLLEHVNASGRAFLSPTVLDGRVTIRLAVGNLQTTREDLMDVWEAIQEAAAMVPAR